MEKNKKQERISCPLLIKIDPATNPGTGIEYSGDYSNEKSVKDWLRSA